MDMTPRKRRRQNDSLDIEISLRKSQLAALIELNNWYYADTLTLYELVCKRLGKTIHYGRFQNSMTELRHKAEYITCNPKQFYAIEPDNKKLVYMLSERGKSALRRHGIGTHAWGTHSKSFPHDWMGAYVVASLYLFADKRFIGPTEIQAKAPEHDHLFKFKVPSMEYTLAPDFPVFGFEYGPDSHRFFLLEMDCDSEDVDKGENFERASIGKKIRAYKELDTPDSNGDNIFYRQLKIPNHQVLFITTDALQKQRILKMVREVCGRTDMFLIRVMPHFSMLDRTPKPDPIFWTGEWESTAGEQFINIAREE
jgi:hypothetical protein